MDNKAAEQEKAPVQDQVASNSTADNAHISVNVEHSAAMVSSMRAHLGLREGIPNACLKFPV
eukprot:626533-Pelagomonas_calceolata.AAC.2